MIWGIDGQPEAEEELKPVPLTSAEAWQKNERVINRRYTCHASGGAAARSEAEGKAGKRVKAKLSKASRFWNDVRAEYRIVRRTDVTLRWEDYVTFAVLALIIGAGAVVLIAHELGLLGPGAAAGTGVYPS